jgi:Family of unknown function (DUF6788)
MTEGDIERRIAVIKRELSSLGPLRRGSLTRQFNVCGNPTCRCKSDPSQRHGPYYQLSFTHNGKSTSQFVREQELPEVQQQVRNYERLRALVDEWVALGAERAQLQRAAQKAISTAKNRPSTRRSLSNRARRAQK